MANYLPIWEVVQWKSAENAYKPFSHLFSRKTVKLHIRNWQPARSETQPQTKRDPMIYHITSTAEWENAVKSGGYTPQPFARDGFIHCSDLYQVEEVANHFYRDLPELILLCIDPALTGIPLVYENLEGKAVRFPHLYGSPLPVESVKAVIALLRDENGDWRLPPALRRPKPRS
jgi:Uncharacterized protein conserved in bacteria